jgi:hypothetical protein
MGGGLASFSGQCVDARKIRHIKRTYFSVDPNPKKLRYGIMPYRGIDPPPRYFYATIGQSLEKAFKRDVSHRWRCLLY